MKGFPTFKYFSYLKTEREYNGGRTVIYRAHHLFRFLTLLYKFQSEDFIKFLNDPDATPEKPKEVDFGEYPGSDSVVKLTDSNFHDRVGKAGKILVMFYAPCKFRD